MVPNGWEIRSLSHVSKVIDCKHRTPHYVESGIPLISPGTIKWGALDLISPTKRVTEEEYKSLMDHCTVEVGDLVMSRNQSVGVLSFVDSNEPFVLGQDTVLIQPENSDSKYLFYKIQSYEVQKKIFKLAGGSTFSRINLADIRKLTFEYPPLLEQQKIAQILSTWDQAISATEKMLENSHQQKKALMQQLLTGKKRLFDENGVRFVGEWEKVHIKDCAECLDNKRVPLNSEQRSSMSGTIPYWGANGIVDYISDFIFDETLVLLAEDGGYFDEYQTRPISNISYGKCWVNNHAHILRAKKNSLNEWIYYCLVHKNILAFVNGGTRAKLNKSDMLMIPLLLPSLQEQKKIVSVLSLADQEIENLQKKLDCLKQEKKALMQQLLTGKKRVKVAA